MACNTIADELVKKGMFEDAIKMYDLGCVSFKIQNPLKILIKLIFIPEPRTSSALPGNFTVSSCPPAQQTRINERTSSANGSRNQRTLFWN